MDVAPTLGAAVSAARPGVWSGLLAALAVLVIGASTTSASERYIIVISGAAGSAAHAERHAQWSAALLAAATGKLGVVGDHVYLLVEPASAKDAASPGPAGASVMAATRDNVRQVFGRLTRLTRDDVVLVVLLGHSTFDGIDAKFNLVGPDLEASDWRNLLAAVPARVVFVNTTGASAPFLQRLAADNRIVITATDNPAQKYDTVFPQYFSEAFASAESDLDKDGRVSVWEAFVFASTGVRQFYRQRGQLSVERPVLDDSGDGVGKEAGGIGPDGSVASRTFLDAADSPSGVTGPALSELLSRRNLLEAEFDELKRKRSFMPAGDYEKQRDDLLIEIARVSRQIRVEQRKRS